MVRDTPSYDLLKQYADVLEQLLSVCVMTKNKTGVLPI
jgi:hypothetical protein